MASHHHHLCHPSAATSTCYCYYYSTCYPPPPPDPLLHSLPPPHIHHPPPQPHLHSPYLNPPHHPQSYHHHQHHQPPHATHPRKQQSEEDQPLVSSLLRRIATLESSLRRKPPSSSSLRDAAARTIQTHFRDFLVRRSRTLRQLKDLAFIKSTLNALKSSLSENAATDPRALYLKGTDLLLQLDSIQGGDPMIRDGKRSISREIVKFLGFIDGLLPKRSELSTSSIELKNKTRVLYSGKKVGTANVGAREERILLEKLRARIENLQGFSRVFEEEDDDEDEVVQFVNSRITSNAKIGSLCNRNGGLVKKHGGAQAKVKKTVSFADNGNVSRVVISADEPVSGKSTSSSDESDSIDEEKELREVEEIGVISKGSEDDDEEEEEETQSEDGKTSYTNAIEGQLGKNFRAEEDYYEISGHGRREEGGFAFSAPLPVKMESRADPTQRKALKIAD